MSKVWFITGSSRGLGKALVEYALSKGDRVTATARDTSSLQQLASQHDPSQLLLLSLDVTDWESSKKAIKDTVAHFGRVDIVVNNAGYANVASVEDVDMTDFREQLDTNFLGVVHVTKAVLPTLRAQKSGHIFQISSVGSRVSSPGLSAYQSAKWAVTGFTAVLAQEVASFGIKATSLEPGAMATDWAGSSMKVQPASEGYETVAQFREFVKGFSDSPNATNPTKVGRIIDELYGASEPPARMLVGVDAVTYGGYAADAQAASDEKWKQVSKSSSEASEFVQPE